MKEKDTITMEHIFLTMTVFLGTIWHDQECNNFYIQQSIFWTSLVSFFRLVLSYLGHLTYHCAENCSEKYHLLKKLAFAEVYILGQLLSCHPTGSSQKIYIF